MERKNRSPLKNLDIFHYIKFSVASGSVVIIVHCIAYKCHMWKKSE